MGLKNIEIPFGSRGIAVCDSIDAMNSKRPYRDALGMEYCRCEIEKNIGIMFDPVIAQSVLDNWHKVVEIN